MEIISATLDQTTANQERELREVAERSPLSEKIWQHRIQPMAPAAPISTDTGTI
jgi:hypothetical protein